MVLHEAGCKQHVVGNGDGLILLVTEGYLIFLLIRRRMSSRHITYQASLFLPSLLIASFLMAPRRLNDLVFRCVPFLPLSSAPRSQYILPMTRIQARAHHDQFTRCSPALRWFANSPHPDRRCGAPQRPEAGRASSVHFRNKWLYVGLAPPSYRLHIHPSGALGIASRRHLPISESVPSRLWQCDVGHEQLRLDGV